MRSLQLSVVLVAVLVVTAHCIPRSPLTVVKELAAKATGTSRSDNTVAAANVSASTPVTPVESNNKTSSATEKTHSVKEALKDGKEAVVNATKDVAEASKDAAVATRDVVVKTSKQVANATKEAVEAGKDLVTPDDVCYDGLGCFSMSSPWFTLLRPLPAPYSPADIDANFYLYTRGKSERFTVRQREGIVFSVDGSDYDGKKETFFITHGFASDGNSSWLSEMKDAILKKYDGNVFLVDWGKGASLLNYFQVAANTRVVGATLAKLGHYLIAAKGADSSRFHIIGHSLGAQISSYAAKNITNVAKLTALDPAQPAFEGYDKAVRLDVTDANFVQVLHTTSRPFIPLIGLGMIHPQGHVDFYLNGGWNQPGCVLPPKPNITSFADLASVPVEVISNFISCPHGRSYEFLTASLANDKCIFWGHRTNVATDVATVLSGSLLSRKLITSPVNDCGKLECSPLGFDAINYPGRGSFSVATSARTPFCVAESDADSKMQRFRGLKPSPGNNTSGEKDE